MHALGQVASFVTSAEVKEDLARRLNGVSSDDIAVTAATPVEDSSDARHSAKSRSYRYRGSCPLGTQPLRAGPRPLVAAPLRPEALKACAAALPGNHDFTAFTPPRPTTSASTATSTTPAGSQDGDILSFRITADAFMRNMVRILVGTMLEAPGAAGPRKLHELLAGAPRSAAGDTAPPHGLYLESVSY